MKIVILVFFAGVYTSIFALKAAKGGLGEAYDSLSIVVLLLIVAWLNHRLDCREEQLRESREENEARFRERHGIECTAAGSVREGQLVRTLHPDDGYEQR